MHTYSLAVCEDDRLIRDSVIRLCGEILEESNIPNVITPFSSAEELECFLEKNGERFDVLILDIQMGGKTGLEFAKELRERENRVSIIFMTGYTDYLEEGYRFQPVHFLLKPLKKERLKEALLVDWKLHHRQKTVTLHKGSRILKLRLAAVVYAEANGNHGVRFLMDGREEEFPVGLSELEHLLPQDQFVRCHNSYLVNLERVSEFSKSCFCMDNGQSLPVGRKYYRQCQDAFVAYVNQ